MAKRFTDTEKWKKPWFRKLDPKWKLAWIYVCDNCDHAGVWPADFELMGFQLGDDFPEEDFNRILGGKLERLEEGKYFVRPFVEFQYGELRDNNSAHQSVIRALNKVGLHPDIHEGLIARPSAILSRLSNKKKLEVRALDHYRCTYCGTPGDDRSLIVDHIVPRSKGGENSDENLTTACISCNAKKFDLAVEVFIDRHGLRSSLSEPLKAKLRILLGAVKELTTPKDKEKDKDKDKVNSSLKEEHDARLKVTSAEISECVQAWGHTLRSFGVPKDPRFDEVSIARLVMKHGFEPSRMALLGAADEKPTETFNPKDHVSVARVEKHFQKFTNLGAKVLARLHNEGGACVEA